LGQLDSEEERAEFRANPEKLVAHMAKKEEWFNKRFMGCIMGTPEQKAAVERLKKRMKDHLKQDRLIKGMLSLRKR
jgi:predicted adenine nucleotide alpha hydrolase (AANH) superfamily ATPase